MMYGAIHVSSDATLWYADNAFFVNWDIRRHAGFLERNLVKKLFRIE